MEGLLYALIAVDNATRRKIGSRHVLHQLINRNIRVIEISNDAIHDFSQVVGSHVGGHAHSNARSAIHQQVRELGGHHAGFFQRIIEVGLKINGVLVQIVEHLIGQTFKTGLGVTHGGRRIPIDGTKVALTIHQWIAQAPVLSHSYHGVVHRRIAVRMVFTQYFTHDTSRLFVGFIVSYAQLTHAVKHTAVHGLQAVAHVG